jgi:hypothetical protein
MLTIFLLANTLSGQDETRGILTQTINDQCIKAYGRSSTLCVLSKSKIVSKFEMAQIYLDSIVQNIVASDSNSFSYEDMVDEVSQMPDCKTEGNRRSISLSEKEKLYLIISILRPSESDPSFNGLIYCFSGIQFAEFGTRNFNSFIYYKIWLYEILENNLNFDATPISEKKDVVYFNHAVNLTYSPYKNSRSEQDLLTEIKFLAEKATTDSLLGLSYLDLMGEVYKSRATMLTNQYKYSRSYAIFKAIENLYQEAVALNPEDNGAFFNLAALYYNEALKIDETDITNNEQNTSSFSIERVADDYNLKARQYYNQLEQLERNFPLPRIWIDYSVGEMDMDDYQLYIHPLGKKIYASKIKTLDEYENEIIWETELDSSLIQLVKKFMVKARQLYYQRCPKTSSEKIVYNVRIGLDSNLYIEGNCDWRGLDYNSLENNILNHQYMASGNSLANLKDSIAEIPKLLSGYWVVSGLKNEITKNDTVVMNRIDGLYGLNKNAIVWSFESDLTFKSMNNRIINLTNTNSYHLYKNDKSGKIGAIELSIDAGWENLESGRKKFINDGINFIFDKIEEDKIVLLFLSR